MGLLEQDVLVIDQVTSFASNDFAIHDASGAVVGRVKTEGGLGSRMLLGSRKFTVYDAVGAPVLKITDPASIGRDKFELFDPAGNQIGRLVKRFAIIGKKLSLELPSGDLQLKGRLFEYNFDVSSDTVTYANISRSWPGLAGGLLGRSRFVVAFAEGTPEDIRLAIIGAVVAVDLIRHKEEEAGGGSGGSSG